MASVWMAIWAFGPFTRPDYVSFSSHKEAKEFARDYWTKYYSSINDLEALVWKAEPVDWQEMLTDQERVNADSTHRSAPQDFDMGYPDERWTPIIPKDQRYTTKVREIHVELC